MHVGNELANGFSRFNIDGSRRIGFPLIDVQFFESNVGISHYLTPHVVQAFERSHASGAHSNGFAIVFEQFFEGGKVHSLHNSVCNRVVPQSHRF